MAAVRYTWMFRAAAVVFVFFGAVWLWRFGLTDYHPEQRPLGLGAGVLALVVGVFLMRRARFAIALSALAAAVVSISAAVFCFPHCTRARHPVRGDGCTGLWPVRGVCGARIARASLLKKAQIFWASSAGSSIEGGPGEVLLATRTRHHIVLDAHAAKC